MNFIQKIIAKIMCKKKDVIICFLSVILVMTISIQNVKAYNYNYCSYDEQIINVKYSTSLQYNISCLDLKNLYNHFIDVSNFDTNDFGYMRVSLSKEVLNGKWYNYSSIEFFSINNEFNYAHYYDSNGIFHRKPGYAYEYHDTGSTSSYNYNYDTLYNSLIYKNSTGTTSYGDNMNFIVLDDYFKDGETFYDFEIDTSQLSINQTNIENKWLYFVDFNNSENGYVSAKGLRFRLDNFNDLSDYVSNVKYALCENDNLNYDECINYISENKDNITFYDITLNDLYLSGDYENSFANAQIVPQKNTEYILYLKPKIFPKVKKFEYKYDSQNNKPYVEIEFDNWLIHEYSIEYITYSVGFDAGEIAFENMSDKIKTINYTQSTIDINKDVYILMRVKAFDQYIYLNQINVNDNEYPIFKYVLDFTPAEEQKNGFIILDLDLEFKNWNPQKYDMRIFITTQSNINTSLNYSKYLIDNHVKMKVTSRDIVYIQYVFVEENMNIVEQHELNIHDILNLEFTELYEKVEIYENIYDDTLTTSKLIYNMTNFFNNIKVHLLSISALIAYTYRKTNDMIKITIYFVVGCKITLYILKRLHF